MQSVLILYPTEFACYSKFKRKIINITKQFNSFKIIYPSDPQNLLNLLSKETQYVDFLEKKEYTHDDFTHAIIFHDDDVFINEISNIRNNGKPLRLIKIKITRVVNIKDNEKYNGKKSTNFYEYIGRGSYWGNPYAMHVSSGDEIDDREDVIRKFKYGFDRDNLPTQHQSEVYKLAGKRLGCFCKPLACHGDVLANFLNAWDDGQ